MCGRFGLFAELDALSEQFNFDPSIMRDIYYPRWNIPPTTPVLSVSRSRGAGPNTAGPNTAGMIRWGMAGARTPQSKGYARPLFNARAETVHALPSFRRAFRERRCLIPASGFYEWRSDGSGGRMPVWFHREDGAPVAFAGIWSRASLPEGGADACAIITCAANGLASAVHHRMPVILPPGLYHDWLDPDTGTDTLSEMLQPGDWHGMAYHPVSAEVNRSSNDYPALTEPEGQTGLFS